MGPYYSENTRDGDINIPPPNNMPPGHPFGPHLRPFKGSSLFGSCFFVESRNKLKQGVTNYLDGRFGRAGVAHFAALGHHRILVHY